MLDRTALPQKHLARKTPEFCSAELRCLNWCRDLHERILHSLLPYVSSSFSGLKAAILARRDGLLKRWRTYPAARQPHRRYNRFHSRYSRRAELYVLLPHCRQSVPLSHRAGPKIVAEHPGILPATSDYRRARTCIVGWPDLSVRRITRRSLGCSTGR